MIDLGKNDDNQGGGGAVDLRLDDEEEKKVKGGTQLPTQERTFFADEYGNLKFVNLVVRRPKLIFFTMIFICYGSSFLLGS